MVVVEAMEAVVAMEAAVVDSMHTMAEEVLEEAVDMAVAVDMEAVVEVLMHTMAEEVLEEVDSVVATVVAAEEVDSVESNTMPLATAYLPASEAGNKMFFFLVLLLTLILKASVYFLSIISRLMFSFVTTLYLNN